MYGAYELRRRANQYILQAGDTSFEMYFILEGDVEVINHYNDYDSAWSDTHEDNVTVLTTLSKGSFFGEIGMLFGTKRTASVQAKTDCTMMVVTKQKLDEALNRFPEMKERVKVLTEKKAEWWEAQKYLPLNPRFGAEFVGDISRKDVKKVCFSNPVCCCYAAVSTWMH